MHVSKDQVFELMETGDLVKTSAARWGTLNTYHVVHDGADYLMTVRMHSEEGYQGDGETLVPAKEVERTIKEWVSSTGGVQ